MARRYNSESMSAMAGPSGRGHNTSSWNVSALEREQEESRDPILLRQRRQEYLQRLADTDLGVTEYRGTLKKSDKDTFYCEVCRVELNSRETCQSHVEGARHQRLAPRDRDVIVKVANPAPLRNKVPTMLKCLVRQTKEPLVGLKYVREFISETDDEIDPYYECGICNKEGDANAMYNHLLGKGHRYKVCKRWYEKYGSRGDPPEVSLYCEPTSIATTPRAPAGWPSSVRPWTSPWSSPWRNPWSSPC